MRVCGHAGMLARVRTPSSHVREREIKKERKREREIERTREGESVCVRERYVEYGY